MAKNKKGKKGNRNRNNRNNRKNNNNNGNNASQAPPEAPPEAPPDDPTPSSSKPEKEATDDSDSSSDPAGPSTRNFSPVHRPGPARSVEVVSAPVPTIEASMAKFYVPPRRPESIGEESSNHGVTSSDEATNDSSGNGDESSYETNFVTQEDGYVSPGDYSDGETANNSSKATITPRNLGKTTDSSNDSRHRASSSLAVPSSPVTTNSQATPPYVVAPDSPPVAPDSQATPGGPSLFDDPNDNEENVRAERIALLRQLKLFHEGHRFREWQWPWLKHHRRVETALVNTIGLSPPNMPDVDVNVLFEAQDEGDINVSRAGLRMACVWLGAAKQLAHERFDEASKQSPGSERHKQAETMFYAVSQAESAVAEVVAEGDDKMIEQLRGRLVAGIR